MSKETRFKDILKVPAPKDVLQQMGQSMLDLSDVIGDTGSPLCPEDVQLIRMAYIPMMKALWDEELAMFTAGQNADNLHAIKEIQTYVDGL